MASDFTARPRQSEPPYNRSFWLRRCARPPAASASSLSHQKDPEGRGFEKQGRRLGIWHHLPPPKKRPMHGFLAFLGAKCTASKMCAARPQRLRRPLPSRPSRSRWLRTRAPVRSKPSQVFGSPLTVFREQKTPNTRQKEKHKSCFPSCSSSLFPTLGVGLLDF